MYDRPSAQELIEAARLHMETAIVPAVKADRKLYFQTLVAINVLKIVGREMDMGAAQVEAEWSRLNAFLGTSDAMPARAADQVAALSERNRTLAAAIRAGEYDANADLLAHLQATAVEQLQVANPRFLATLAAEDDDPTMDAWDGR